MRKLLSLAFIFILLKTNAQSDGARSHLPSPTGVWAVNTKYLNLDQNILPSGNLLLKNANINVDVIPITLIHTFNIGKTWARVFVMVAPVSSFKATTPISALPINNINKSGFSDGWVSFEIGLKGNPAKNIIEFSKTAAPKFTMNGQFRIWYSGSYDPQKFVNLGSNRTTFDIGFPMAIRLNNDLKRTLWLETWPGVQFYTANNEPAKPSTSNTVTQHPLIYLENHLSYNITPKFYAGVDLRFQHGGESFSDGEGNDNRISIIGSGLFAGYKFLPFVDFYANYGGIIAAENNAQSNMFRLNLVVSYINMKKYKNK